MPFDAKPVDQALEPVYMADGHTAHLFIIGAAQAVAIGCVGL